MDPDPGQGGGSGNSFSSQDLCLALNCALSYVCPQLANVGEESTQSPVSQDQGVGF